MIGFREFRVEDLEHITFRPEDERECRDSTGQSCREVILSSDAERLTGISPKGEPFCVFGRTPTQVGFVWLLAGDNFLANVKTLVRETPKVLAMWHQRSPLLFTVADPRNDVHVRWLHAIGFEHANTIQVRGLPFHVLTRSPCAIPHSPLSQ